VALVDTPVALTAKPRPESAYPELLPLDAGQQYRFGFSMDACVGCHSCEVACAEQNGLPAGTTWRRVGEIEGGLHRPGPSGPATGEPRAEYRAQRFHLSMSCNHCLEPLCLEGCPTGAYEKLANGVVAHHADDCIGCQYCTWGCPYNVPVFQPDRRIVTKCDMCLPRLEAGREPACVSACPTHAITVEAVDVAAWRADHSAADAPELPDSSLTLSTTRIALPADVPVDAFSASDWNLRPEHPHWPLVWLTLVSQVAVGVTVAASSSTHRVAAALLAAAAMAGAILHLGRPAMAWKALRGLRRSWLSREVALLGAYAGAAVGAAVVPALAPAAVAAGVAGVYASARLYVVPGRPAWNTWLTPARFGATAAACGPLLTGRPLVGVAGAALAAAAGGANLLRLARGERQPWWGSVRLELVWFRWWSALRWGLLAGAVAAALGGSVAAAAVLAVTSELIGRWLFFVTVVPLNMPGSFWRGEHAGHR
jgi:formate dehydrogenase iron-sulfur subunit